MPNHQSILCAIQLPNRLSWIGLTLVLTAASLTPGCGKQASTQGSAETPAATEASPDIDPTRLYCQEHETYEDVCFICHPEMRDKGRLWCKEHDRYEDRCFDCHPELRDPDRVLCQKHFLFEDECFLCRPELKPGILPAPNAAVPNRLMCNEHGVAEDECGICHPELVSSLVPGQALKVRFASMEAAGKAHLTVQKPQIVPREGGVDCYAEIQFDQNRLAEIVTPVGGIIHSVEVDLGHRVTEGTVLARIGSAALGEAVARARLAKQTLDRERSLRADRITAESELQEAEAVYASADQALRILGVDDVQIAALFETSTEYPMLELRAPFSGEIVERNAVRGALVETGRSLFTLVDRTSVWAMLNLPETHLAQIHVGQTVVLQVDALPDRTFTGTLTWIAAQVDDRTRMVRARVEVPNADGALRAQMFSRARILTSGVADALTVPQSAIQRIDGHPIAFVKLADDLYEARSVHLGATLDGSVEVLEGVHPGDSVVTANGFIAKSQLLLSRLGAGCVDD